MADDSDQEKTEAATPRKLEQAREEGQVPRSRELATFAVTMTGVAMLMMTGAQIYRTLGQILERSFTFNGKTLLHGESMLAELKQSTFDILLALAPILGALFVIAAAVPILIGGWNFSGKAIEPKFSKLNPLSGIKRMFSVSAALEGGKAVLKSLVIGGVATWVIWKERGEILNLITLPIERSMATLVGLMEYTFLVVVGAMLLIVVVDVPFQLWNYQKNLRMSKEEIKQEYKQSEGSPEIKGRIRQLQREAARKRMMQDIPTASVVVTNPTHYAVALKYEEGMRAPKVIAKGSLRLAEKIIESAKEHKITLMRTPPFARALYHHAELGEEIPQALYTAAAQVLAYVFQLKQYQTQGGFAPIYPENLPVPPELDPASKDPLSS